MKRSTLTGHAALLLMVCSACGPRGTSAPVAPVLDHTDVEVVRTVLQSVIVRRLDATAEPIRRTATLVSLTRAVQLTGVPPVTRPPSAPYPFREPVPPPPPSSSTLSAMLLTAGERAAWEERNGIQRAIPDMRLDGFHVAVAGVASVVTVSSPVYAEPLAAVIYADFVCGTTCGEGWLIRLGRGPGGWKIRETVKVWVS